MNIHLITPNTLASRVARFTALGAVLVALLISGAFYYKYSHPPLDSISLPAQSGKGVTKEKAVKPVTTQSASLGADLYRASSDPLGDKIPDSGAAVPNPVNALYKNPFN